MVNAVKKTRLDIYGDFPNSQIDAAIAEWIHSERDRRILHYKLVDDLSYEKIAELEDMSPRRIQDIVYDAEDKLYPHLEYI